MNEIPENPQHWFEAMARAIEALAAVEQDNYQAQTDRRALVEALIAAKPKPLMTGQYGRIVDGQ